MAQARGTGGAVPVLNAKGEITMEKVKVKRYVAGQRPEFAEDDSDEEDFLAPPQEAVQQTEEETSADSRPLVAEIEVQDDDDDDDDLAAARRAALLRRRQMEEDDDDEDETPNDRHDKPDRQRRAAQVAEVIAASEDEESEDEDAIAARRARLRQLAQAREEEEAGLDEEVAIPDAPVAKAEADSSSSGSEYETDSEEDSEDELAPVYKPVFISKKSRQTKLEEEARMEREAQRLVELKLEQQEAAERARDAVQQAVVTELQQEAMVGKLNFVDDDDENANQEEEFELWKVRELKRLKRDREIRERLEREKLETDKVHEMTDAEREEYFKANPKLVTNQAERGKMSFMQKYYHRGAFFMDEEHDVFKRNVAEATEDQVKNKASLPKVMQVKNFGMMSQTKYTHLKDQDTTDKTAAWAQNTTINAKAVHKMAGLKQVGYASYHQCRHVLLCLSYTVKSIRLRFSNIQTLFRCSPTRGRLICICCF
eukprot:TRINITY_DN5978_c0_g1_i1.p1 TRINITY_DN5978_c0_g1~~TRINITY_DN5978_c0_g1_i1.p1  ORF type:complete len:484 (+),score=130.57 TRINITY_DN5978_c0_g1_i1:81-1532(+)